MSGDREIAQKLVFALRRIVADAEGGLLHGGNPRKSVETMKNAIASAADDAAKQLGMPPYDKPSDKPS